MEFSSSDDELFVRHNANNDKNTKNENNNLSNKNNNYEQKQQIKNVKMEFQEDLEIQEVKQKKNLDFNDFLENNENEDQQIKKQNNFETKIEQQTGQQIQNNNNNFKKPFNKFKQEPKDLQNNFEIQQQYPTIVQQKGSGNLLQSQNQKKIVLNQLSNMKIQFKELVAFFEQMTKSKSNKKSKEAKRFFQEYLFKNNRQPYYSFAILRLIMPNIDRERGNYNIKEKVLGDIISDALILGDEIKNRFRHYKNTSYHPHDSPTGDFGEVVLYNLKNFCQTDETLLTVAELNQQLDRLAIVGDKKKQTDIMRDILRKSTAKQAKWICRIILKDLKIGISHEKALNFYHPDALEYYNATSSLAEICKEFVDLEKRLQNVLRLFHPIRPMLADKKNMDQLCNILNNKKFLIETKYDGERIQCHMDQEKLMFFSRNSNDYTHVYGRKMSDIVRNNLKRTHSCILDGEMIVVDKENNVPVQFGNNKTVAMDEEQGSELRICYKVFDILYIKGNQGEEVITMNSVSLDKRKKILQNIINEVPNQIEIVQGLETCNYNDIQVEFKEAIQRNEEGLIIKQLESLYVPNERSISWIKMKGDYFEGLTDTLDLIVIGGYFGNNSYRTAFKNLNTDWSDNLTHFLLGVAQKTDENNPQQSLIYPFCKVGTGYTGQQLQELRNSLRVNWVNITGTGTKFSQNIPNFIYQNWNPSVDDRPDAFIKNPKDSRIIEIKAAEIIRSHSWPTNFTLRFPRVEKIRYDKDWNECMTMQQLEECTSNLKRKRADSGSDDSEEGEQQGKNQKDKGSIKKKKKLKERKGMKTDQVLKQFQDTDTSNVAVVSNIFNDMVFYIVHLQDNNLYEKSFLEQQIVAYGGRKVQNDSDIVTHYVSDVYNFRIDTIVNKYKCNVYYPTYIIESASKNKLMENAPRFLLHSNEQQQILNANLYDKYGDSYTMPVDKDALKQIFKQMTDRNYKEELSAIEKIEIKNTKKIIEEEHLKDDNLFTFCLYDPDEEYMQSSFQYRELFALINQQKGFKMVTKLTHDIKCFILIDYNQRQTEDIQFYIAESSNSVEIWEMKDTQEFLLKLLQKQKQKFLENQLEIENENNQID